MKTIISATALVAGWILSFGCYAAPPADAPAGSTGLCNDGTYSSNAEKKGACKGHKGVKEWYAEATTGKADAKAGTGTPAASTPASKKTAPAMSSTAAAPGGGPGMVWANETSKVYHCPGDKYYGKTKHGEYLSEADAKTKGFRPDHGKACT